MKLIICLILIFSQFSFNRVQANEGLRFLAFNLSPQNLLQKENDFWMSLLQVSYPAELESFDWAVQKKSISLNSIPKSMKDLMVKQAFKTFNENSGTFLESNKPRFIIPIAVVDGERYFVFDKSNLLSSNFDTFLPLKDLESQLYISFITRDHSEFAVMPMHNIDGIRDYIKYVCVESPKNGIYRYRFQIKTETVINYDLVDEHIDADVYIKKIKKWLQMCRL